MAERTKYQRTVKELEQVASKFWPDELSALEANLSVIPLLLKTQEQFLNIIGIETPNLESLFAILESATLPANLFLKHLVILADFGGEMLQRVGREFAILFPVSYTHLDVYKRQPQRGQFITWPQSRQLTKVDVPRRLRKRMHCSPRASVSVTAASSARLKTARLPARNS